MKLITNTYLNMWKFPCMICHSPIMQSILWSNKFSKWDKIKYSDNGHGCSLVLLNNIYNNLLKLIYYQLKSVSTMGWILIPCIIHYTAALIWFIVLAKQPIFKRDTYFLGIWISLQLPVIPVNELYITYPWQHLCALNTDFTIKYNKWVPWD